MNKNLDLQLGFRSQTTASEIAKEYHISLQTDTIGEVIIPTGPLVPHGMINYKRYLARASIAPGLQPARIAQKIGEKYKLCEVISHNIQVDGVAIPILKGSLECYLEFDSQNEALNMAKEIEVDGIPVKIWHKGYYECTE